MKSRGPRPLILAICLAVGCSKGPQAVDPDAQAKDIKRDALQLVVEAKKNPKGAAERASTFTEKLETYVARGDEGHKDIYALLQQKCKELVSLAQRSPGSAEVNRKVEEISTVANKLPGDITLQQEPAKQR